MLKKFRYLNTDVHVYEQEENEKPRLLQHERIAPLSYIRDDNGKLPKAIINCSYFTPKFVVGRNQGDLRNDTVDNGFCDLVFCKDGSYHFGHYKSWDYQSNVVAGMSLATFLVKDGQPVQEVSSFADDKLNARRPQTAIGILQDGTILLIVSEGDGNGDRGINGYELRTLIMREYPTIKFLGQCDGGGSSEMIVNGKIINRLSEGRERAMWNGFALIEKETIEKPEAPSNPNAKFTVSEWMKYLEEKVWEQNIYKLGGIGRYDGPNGIRTFDCVGIFKSKLWNYPEEPNNYGVTYPDANVGMMKNRCTKLMPFDEKKMKPGMVVFIGTEHIGMVGDPKFFKEGSNPKDCIYECTPAFQNKVLRSSVKDRKTKCWDTMGYADFVIYDEEKVEEPSVPQHDHDEIDELKKQVMSLTSQLVEANKQKEKLEIQNLKFEEQLSNANEKLLQIKNIIGDK